MKEQYLKAEMDVVKFSVEDVIATSANRDDQGEAGVPWPNDRPTFGTNPPGGELGTAWS